MLLRRYLLDKSAASHDSRAASYHLPAESQAWAGSSAGTRGLRKKAAASPRTQHPASAGPNYRFSPSVEAPEANRPYCPSRQDNRSPSSARLPASVAGRWPLHLPGRRWNLPSVLLERPERRPGQLHCHEYQIEERGALFCPFFLPIPIASNLPCFTVNIFFVGLSAAFERGRGDIFCAVADRNDADGCYIIGDAEQFTCFGKIFGRESGKARAKAFINRGQQEDHHGAANIHMPIGDAYRFQ